MPADERDIRRLRFLPQSIAASRDFARERAFEREQILTLRHTSRTRTARVRSRVRRAGRTPQPRRTHRTTRSACRVVNLREEGSQERREEPPRVTRDVDRRRVCQSDVLRHEFLDDVRRGGGTLWFVILGSLFQGAKRMYAGSQSDCGMCGM